MPDNLIGKSFDEGFGDIVRSCKKLKHLSLSRLLTDLVFLYIGFYTEQLQLEMLIVESCQKLKHLSLSGLLTGLVFLYIGLYAEQLETLTVEFSGQSDTGILYVLNGCSKLRKLVIRNSPNGDAAHLEAADKYEKVRFFWMSRCNMTLEGCEAVAKKVPRLNIEMLKDGHLSRSADDVQIRKIIILVRCSSEIKLENLDR